MKTELEKKLTIRITKLSITSVILAVAIFLCSASYAWFSYNEEVDTNDMMINVTNPTLSLYNTGSNQFSLVDDKDNLSSGSEESTDITIPGTSAIYKIVLQNETETDLKVSSFGFNAPKVYLGTKEESIALIGENGNATKVKEYDEYPRYTEGGTALYYGTQLAARMVKISLFCKDSSAGSQYGTSELYLKEDLFDLTDSNGVIVEDTVGTSRPKQPLLVASDLEEPDDVILYGPEYTLGDYSSGDEELIIPPEHIVIFYIQVAFIDSGSSQDAYKGFAFNASGMENSKKERCSRQVFITLDHEKV